MVEKLNSGSNNDSGQSAAAQSASEKRGAEEMPDEESAEKGKISAFEIEAVLNGAPVGNLALAREERPYVIPLNYLYSEGEIFFHCNPRGRKIDYIRVNPRACFQVAEVGGLIRGDSPCSHNYRYRSVIVEGVIEEVRDPAAKESILRKLTARYAAAGVAEKPITAKRLETVAVYRLIPEKITGRRDS